MINSTPKLKDHHANRLTPWELHPTRTGKNRWDRSVIWGMLRNPAYVGKAVFGKTMTDHSTPAGLNRRA
ncbi:recombinase family protein, partial [Frankia sp. CiP3]|uniref:recombinase family protein n=1 Tax=Frankia sp. CiP3 TaxID=2880971 RepID=UPI001EF6D7D9